MGRKKRRDHDRETELLNREESSPRANSSEVATNNDTSTTFPLLDQSMTDEQVTTLVEASLPGPSASGSKRRGSHSPKSPRRSNHVGSSIDGEEGGEYVALEEIEPGDGERVITPPRRFSREFEPPRGPADDVSTDIDAEEEEYEAERHRAIWGVVHHCCCMMSAILFIVLLALFAVMDGLNVGKGGSVVGVRIATVVVLWGCLLTFLAALVYFFIYGVGGTSDDEDIDPMVPFGSCGRTGYGWPPPFAFLDNRLLSASQRFPVFLVIGVCFISFGVVATVKIFGEDIPLWLLFFPFWLLSAILITIPWIALLMDEGESVMGRLSKLSHLCYFPVLLLFFCSFTILFVQKASLGYNYTWDYVFFPMWCAVGVSANIGCWCPLMGAFSNFDYRRDDRLARRAWRHDEEYIGVRCQHRILEVWVRIMWLVGTVCLCLSAVIACKRYNGVDDSGHHIPLFAVISPILAGGCFFIVFDSVALLVQCLSAANILEELEFMEE